MLRIPNILEVFVLQMDDNNYEVKAVVIRGIGNPRQIPAKI